jgi:chromosome segregation ATPase
VGELEASLRENQSKAREELDRLKQEFANAEMDHATASAQSEEQIEELEAKLDAVQAEREGKMVDNEKLRAEMGQARERNIVLEAELQKWHKTDEEYKSVIAAAEKARDELERNCASLRADLEALKQSSATEKASLESRSVQLEREAHGQVDAMRTQHERDLQKMQQSHQNKLDELSTKLSSAQEASKQAQAELESQLDKREKKLAEYHKKVNLTIPIPFPHTYPKVPN